MARLTINNVNKALAAAGIEAELVKGNGYFWFSCLEALLWTTSCVYVSRLSDLPTVEAWVAEYQAMRADNAQEPAKSEELPAPLKDSVAVSGTPEQTTKPLPVATIVDVTHVMVDLLKDKIKDLQRRKYVNGSGLFVVCKDSGEYLQGVNASHDSAFSVDIREALVCASGYANVQAEKLCCKVVPIESAIAADLLKAQKQLADLEKCNAETV